MTKRNDYLSFSDLDMSGRPGSSGVNELLGSLLSNVTTGQSASPLGPLVQEALGSLLSTTGQTQPSGSRLSPAAALPPTTSEVEQPPISPLLLGAGRLLLQNWQPILQVKSCCPI